MINKISLKPIVASDSEKVAIWKSDKELSKLIMSNYKVMSNEDAKEWIKLNSNDKNQVLNGIYVDGNELIGISRLMFIDFESGVCELGIYLGEDKYRGTGLGSSALLQTIKYAFNEIKLRKIYLKVNKNNLRAINLYTKIGFQIEGELNEHLCVDYKKYETLLYMSLFKN